MQKNLLIAALFLLACGKTPTESATNVPVISADTIISAQTTPETPPAKPKLLQRISALFSPNKKEVSVEKKVDTTAASIVSKPVPAPATQPFEMPLLPLKAMLQDLSPAPKAFSVPADEPITIELPQGTKIFIPQGAFMIEETEAPVNGKVLVLAQEYLGIQDMLRANLSTVAPEGMLETGGMLYVEAQFEGKRCALRKDKSMQILLPTQGREKKKDMQLFSGERESDGQLLWNALAPTDFFKQDTVVRTSISTMDSFLGFIQKSIASIKQFSWAKMGKPIVKIKRIVARGGDMANVETQISCPKDYFSLNNFEVKYCELNYQNGRKRGDTLLSFFKKTEKPFNFHVKVHADLATSDLISPKHPDQFHGIPSAIAYQMARIIRRHKWIPGENEVDFEVFVSDKYKKLIEKKYGNRLIEGDCEGEYRKTYEDYVKNYKPTISYYSPSRTSAYEQLRNYVFRTTQLGWINCDRFMNIEAKTDLMVNIGKMTDLQAFLIFHKMRSVLSVNTWEAFSAAEDGFCRFENVPLQEKVTLFVIKTENNKQYYALKDTEISDDVAENLDFQPLDRQVLTSLTENLGKRFN